MFFAERARFDEDLDHHRSPMRSALLASSCWLVAILACLSFGSASAQGINLAWDDCGAFGTSNKFGTATFACNTNSSTADRTSSMIGSYLLHRPVADVVGNDMMLTVTSSDLSLPSWWDFTDQLDPPGCRAGQISYTFRSPNTSCDDWPGSSPIVGVVKVQAGIGGANRERLAMFCAYSIGAPQRHEASVEYVSFTLTVNNGKTVGAGSCAGCDRPVCIRLDSITVDELTSLDEPIVLTTPMVSNFVTWNDSAGSLNCAVSPVRHSTWGQVKGMYR
jgi:hypothetical protein